MTKGFTADLQVNVSGAVPVVDNNDSSRFWSYPNGSVITTGGKFSISSNRYTLTISYADLTESGVYTFTALNVAGMGMATITLNVEGETTLPMSLMYLLAIGLLLCCSCSCYHHTTYRVNSKCISDSNILLCHHRKPSTNYNMGKRWNVLVA